MIGAATIERTPLDLEDEADALLAASNVPDMNAAAQRLRLTALGVRQWLMRSQITGSPLQFDPALPDPEARRMELADLATDVVTAVDYLLSTLGAPIATRSRLVLAEEVGPERADGRSDEAALDRLTRRRLDARGTTIRLAGRLLTELRSDVANFRLNLIGERLTTAGRIRVAAELILGYSFQTLRPASSSASPATLIAMMPS
jgi:hypothetical protein